jgi:hypothetical protein|tara:strand:+ start:116 stop:313 length:198 start_codon:yes stop_codon:yes gene_type:complete
LILRGSFLVRNNNKQKPQNRSSAKMSVVGLPGILKLRFNAIANGMIIQILDPKRRQTTRTVPPTT